MFVSGARVLYAAVTDIVGSKVGTAFSGLSVISASGVVKVFVARFFIVVSYLSASLLNSFIRDLISV